MKTIKNLLLISFLFVAVLSKAQDDSKVFIEFDKEKVTKSEFKRVYTKNNSGDMVAKSTVDEYLDLYINFKLKVKEAEARGLDTVSSFISELKGYRKQLAQPYLSADNMMEELKKEAYARLQQEVKASHILISVAEDASPEDTMKAYQIATKVKKLIENGKDFNKIAAEYSNDPSARTNGGDLGYFTAFYMVYPFEAAAYNTKVGNISAPARTRFGYHIVKVEDKRPASGNMKAAHILVSTDPEISKTADPEAKIMEIYQKIQEGESFEQMAAQFSDDTRSSSNGGVLPMFGIGRMVPEFEEVAFGLEKDGEISKPFKTQFGWHIVKRVEKVGIGTYEEVEAELIQRVKKDSRSNLTEDAVINNIKKQYGFTEKIKERDDFYTVIDSSFFKKEWSSAKAKGLTKTMFTIGKKEVNQQEFATYLMQEQGGKSIDFRVLVNKKYNSFKEQTILDYKDGKLEEEYPEFKALMQEYHDGILLFNLTDELVWKKAVEDTVGLENFYEKNKEDYRWGKRADAVVYSVLNEKIADEAKKMIKDGMTVKEIEAKVNEKSPLNLKYEMRKYEKGENEIIDQLDWKKGVSKNVNVQGRVSFAHFKEILEPTYKTLDDSKGVITSDYQEFLQEQWINSLRKKYSYTVNKEILKELNAELN